MTDQLNIPQTLSVTEHALATLRLEIAHLATARRHLRELQNALIVNAKRSPDMPLKEAVQLLREADMVWDEEEVSAVVGAVVAARQGVIANGDREVHVSPKRRGKGNE